MNENANNQMRSEKAPKLRRSARRRNPNNYSQNNNNSHYRHSRHRDDSNGDGPSLITMLFVAVALATIFNLSKSGASDPMSVHFKGQNIRGGMSEEQYMRLQAQQQMNGGYHGNMPLLNGAPQYSSSNSVNGFGYGNNSPQMNQLQTWDTSANNNMPLQGQGQQNALVMQQVQQAPAENFNIQGTMTEMIENVDNIGITGAEGIQQNAGGGVQADVTVVPDTAPAAEGTIVPDAPPAEGGVVPNPVLAGYKDNWDPLENGDQPVFWHIPKAGGSTVKDIMGTCHRFTMASEYGIVEGHENDPVSFCSV